MNSTGVSQFDSQTVSFLHFNKGASFSEESEITPQPNENERFNVTLNVRCRPGRSQAINPDVGENAVAKFVGTRRRETKYVRSQTPDKSKLCAWFTRINKLTK
jgi:hypothetical protein